MSFLFGTRAQRTFKKIQDLAAGDMVDQAAVMVEEELDTLLEDHDISAKLVPFLMDIGHPDLGGRIGERIVRKHSDLRMSISRLLEEKQAQFPRSIELLRVIWKNRLHQRDFNGLMDILGRTERVTINRFADSIQSSAQALSGVTGRELGAGIERILAWSVINLHRGDPSAAMEVLVDAAERCRFPEESLSRLSGWIVARTGGADMDVNLKRVRILAAIGDRERAISELPSLYEADTEVLNRAIALVEKELVPNDSTPKATISLSRLMARAGKTNDACLMLDPLIGKHSDSSMLEQVVTGVALGAPGSARAQLLQARLRLSRGETTQALDSIEKSFSCPDVAESPVVDICRSFIESGIDRDDLVKEKLGEFLTEQGTVEEAVRILSLSVRNNPEWVFQKLQLLLKRDRTSAAVLTLLAVVMLVLDRGGEAAATLKHLAARKDVKSKQDIVSVLSDFDDLMTEHKELRRLRAASGASNGKSADSARDWIELLISGEPVTPEGCLVMYDTGAYKGRAAEIAASGLKPDSPAAELLLGAAKLESGSPEGTSKHLAAALDSSELAERVTELVASLPFSVVAAMKPMKLFTALNAGGMGKVVAKLLPLMASGGAEDWMDDLAARISLKNDSKTAFFRLSYFIELGKPGTAAASVQGLETGEGSLDALVKGCSAFAAGDMALATEHLSKAASAEKTAFLARTVLSSVIDKEKGSAEGAIALARADIKTGNTRGAAETLKPLLRERLVLDFLEESVKEVPSAYELHACLALARLFAEDPEGFREAAGTALEGDSEMAEELVSSGMEFSLENDYAPGLVFCTEAGMKHVKDFQPEPFLRRAITLEPSLSGRIESLDVPDLCLGMLLSLAKCNSSTFQSMEIPEDLDLPEEMITVAHSAWKEQKALRALSELEKLAASSGHLAEAHAVRVSLAEAGEDRSRALLFDALEDPACIGDLLRLCSDKETASDAMQKLFPEGRGLEDGGIQQAAAEMLIRCRARESIFDLAMTLLRSPGTAVPATVSRIVDLYIPTVGEEGSLSVRQVVELLLECDRIPEAFSLARGDSPLLARIRQRVMENDSESSSPDSLLRSHREKEITGDAPAMLRGQALWNSGERVAACGIWRKAYEDAGDPAYLLRLEHAFELMGSALERAAVRRLLGERHPDSLLRITGVPGGTGTLSMIKCNLQ